MTLAFLLGAIICGLSGGGGLGESSLGFAATTGGSLISTGFSAGTVSVFTSGDGAAIFLIVGRTSLTTGGGAGGSG